METNGLLFVERIDDQLKKMGQTRVDMCNVIGIRKQSVTDWKYRGNVPAADIAIEIADYLNVDLRWLLYGDDTKAVDPDVLEASRLFSILDAADRQSVLSLLHTMTLRYTEQAVGRSTADA